MSLRFSFSLLILLGATLGHIYLYRRLVWTTVRSLALRLLVLAVLVLMTLAMINRRRLGDFLPEGVAETASVATYTWMGVALFLVLALLAVDLTRGVLTVGRRLRRPAAASEPLPQPVVDEERRRFLARTVAGSAAFLGTGMAAYGSWRAFAPPLVTELAIRIPKLPRALDGLSIVQLTDIHVGAFIQRRFMDELVQRANALRPDLVAVTGDLVDGDVATLGPAVAALGNLKARFGRFFVTGNHEYISGEDPWVEFLQTLDIQVLRNRRVSIGDAGGSLDLVGVDDWSGGRRRGRPGYDLDRALEGRNPDRAAVLLAHQPSNFRVAAEQGVDLQISGHTHGGQLFPMTAFIGMIWEHSAGLYRHGASHIYVSRGCGFWGPPMRFGSPPELVKLVLTT
ncbi:metallophosphoesterase [Hyalangium gracile]|uniref:metallophosphoesterase n=1 Tax=Hyalangium gracile TaxID=394092 RepID=UPI001CCD3246|nr:metallophosphoesterase [Hyalangium gracile]